MAEEAVRCLLEQEKGNPLPARQTLAGRMVVRRSCGCDRGTITQATSSLSRRRSRPPTQGLDVYFLSQNESVRAELSRASQGAFHGIPSWEVPLINALVDEMRGVPGVSFLDAVESLLEVLFKQRIEVLRLAGVLRALRGRCILALGEEAAESARADDLLHQAASLVSEMAVRAHARASLEAEQLAREINRLGTCLSDAGDWASLRSLLPAALASLGLSRFDVVCYESSQQQPRLGQLMFSLHGDCTGAKVLEADKLLGELSAVERGRNATERGRAASVSTSRVALPLFYRGKTLGFCLCDFALVDATYYEALRIHLSAALYWISVPDPPSARESG